MPVIFFCTREKISKKPVSACEKWQVRREKIEKSEKKWAWNTHLAREKMQKYRRFFFYSGEGCFYTREKIEFSEITRLGVTRVINFWKITRWNLLVFHKILVRFYSISSKYSILIYSFFQKKWKLLDLSSFLINFGIFHFYSKNSFWRYSVEKKYSFWTYLLNKKYSFEFYSIKIFTRS